MICPASLTVWIQELEELATAITLFRQTVKYESTILLLGTVINSLNKAINRLNNLKARYYQIRDL